MTGAAPAFRRAETSRRPRAARRVPARRAAERARALVVRRPDLVQRQVRAEAATVGPRRSYCRPGSYSMITRRSRSRRQRRSSGRSRRGSDSGTCRSPRDAVAAEASAASTLPCCAAELGDGLAGAVEVRASTSRGSRARRSCGGSAHVTFSCAAAWIASYSFGATTPRKLPRRTICDARDVLDRARVDARGSRVRPVAVGALAARPDDPAVQHPRDADVVHVRVRAGHLRRDVERGTARPDERVLRDGLHPVHVR